MGAKPGAPRLAHLRRRHHRIVLYQSEEGYSLRIPGLPGCCSQGGTEAEAIANIKIAPQEYLDAVEDLLEGGEVREIKAGFHVLRQGKHVVMTDGVRVLTVPRHNPVNAINHGSDRPGRGIDR